ncbi:MAG: hypothetical protein NTV21_10070 [Planctomycetota bacterium]|nr:hypothetical protein [Planctomycetota bacterium]
MTSLSTFVHRGLGLVAAASVLSFAASAQCITGGPGGAIPAAGTGGGGTFPNTLPGSPFTQSLAVTIPGGATVLNSVKLNGVTHTWGGDMQFVLENPAGAKFNVLCGMNTDPNIDFGGSYTIVDATLGAPSIWGAGSPAPTGTYTQDYGTFTNGAAGISNTPLEQIPISSGTWKLYGYDWVGGDLGAVTSWELCFGTPTGPSAPTTAPTLTAPANGATVIPPVNFTWSTLATATSYDLELDGNVTTGITVQPFVVNTLASGTHNWRVRGVNNVGAGPWAALQPFDVPAPPPASTCTTNGAGAGLVPASGTGGTGSTFPTTLPATPYANTYAVTVPAGATQIVNVNFNFTVEHTWVGDIQFVLTDPSGVSHNLVCRPLGNCDLNGAYSIYETAGLPWPTVCPASTDVPTGAYDQFFGTWPTGTNNIFNTPLGSIPVVSGNWTLTIYDWAGGDVGTLGDWSLCFNTPTGPVSYCTAGTTTNGCNATISAANNPSVSAANPCVINVTNVEGAKSGLIFYSITGSSSSAWNASSFLCVKAPTQRTGTQVSTGTAGLCDGTLTLDWNAYQAAFPAALGNPWAAGNKAWAQAWFRDPPAGKSTNLSNAIEMTYVP